MRRRNTVFGLALLILGNAVSGELCSPKNTVRIVVADESPDIPGDHFARLPKVIYRKGSTFARIEEAVDEPNGIHGLIVVSEPDSWIINLRTSKGTHAVDKHEPFVVHLPAFAGYAGDNSFPAELKDLEFGCEVEFFDRWKSPEAPLRDDPEGRVRRAFGANGWLAVLIRRQGSSTPSHLFLLKEDDVVGSFKYESYAVVPEDPSRFAPPKGVVVSEPPPN